jgi:GAF domain-containing protein
VNEPTPPSAVPPLAPASQRLPATLAADLLEQSLHAVPTIDLSDIGARLLAPLVNALGATRASLMLVNPDTGKLRIVAGLGLRAELIGRDIDWRPSSISEWVFRKGQGLVLHGAVRRDGLVGTAEGVIESSMCLPLEGEGGTLGVLNLAGDASVAPFHEDEMAAIRAMLPPVAGAVERALRANMYSRHVAQLVASRGLVGRTLLAPGRHEARHYEIGFARLASARSGSAVCERFPLAQGGHLLLAMEPRAEGADGLLTSAFAQGLFAAGAARERSAAALAARANEELCARIAGHGETAAWIAALSPGGRVTSCNAGYPSPLWVPNDDSAIAQLCTGGPMIGAEVRATWQEEQVRLLPGDMVVAVSTGVLAARNVTGQPLGLARLLECVADWRRQPLDTLTQEIVRTVIAWSGRPVPIDDLTVLAVRFSPGD